MDRSREGKGASVGSEEGARRGEAWAPHTSSRAEQGCLLARCLAWDGPLFPLRRKGQTSKVLRSVRRAYTSTCAVTWREVCDGDGRGVGAEVGGREGCCLLQADWLQSPGRREGREEPRVRAARLQTVSPAATPRPVALVGDMGQRRCEGRRYEPGIFNEDATWYERTERALGQPVCPRSASPQAVDCAARRQPSCSEPWIFLASMSTSSEHTR
jgi:hypothetical protein